MRLGIIGLPQSGKTTIFNALTRGNQPVTTSGGRFEVHTAVVDVPDQRVDRLSALLSLRKPPMPRSLMQISLAWMAVRVKVVSRGQLLNQLSQMDGFLHVVRVVLMTRMCLIRLGVLMPIVISSPWMESCCSMI
jgi:ribosome-binding ATPase